jgi:hypothetical protein
MNEQSTYESVDSLVERCFSVFFEIMQFAKSLEKKIVSPYGFDEYYSMLERTDNLSRLTRPGKQLSKSSILLVHGVVEALLTRGKMQEKDLKEYLVSKFKILGLKVSNRSVFGGTSLEVSSVCNVLSSLGILENVTESDEDDVPFDSSVRVAVTRLNDALRIKFENTPFESSNRSDAVTSQPTDALLDFNIVDIIMTEPSVANPTLRNFDDIDVSILEDSFMPPNPAINNNETSIHFSSEAIDAVAESDVSPAAASAEIVSIASVQVSAPSKKQPQSGKKFWRIRNSETFPSSLLNVASNASSQLFRWMQKTHNFAAQLEIEEKMLRRVCYEAGVPLPRTTFRMPTKYVEVRTPATKQQATNFSVASSMSESVDSIALPTSSCSTLRSRDLFDGAKRLTGDALIDKVLRSRRQRGSSSHSNVFSAEPLQTLRSVMCKTWQSLHQHNAEDTEEDISRSSKKPRTGSLDAILLADYVCSAQQSSASQLQAGAILAALSSSSQLLLSGTHPSVTTASVRRYAPPHSLLSSMIETGVSQSDSLYPLQLLDLAITTVEVPWKSLAPEFTLVVLDDSGEFVDGLSNQLLSHAELSLEAQQSANGQSVENSIPEKIGKKRSRSSSQLTTEDQPQLNDYGSMNYALKRKVISEVHAPQVKSFSQVSFKKIGFHIDLRSD